MLRERVIVWFRQDLRLHDNEALFEAIRQSKEVIPVFVLDERQIFGKTSFDFPKIGKFRMKFLLESIQDLRLNLKKLGSDLIVRVGHTENILINIANQTKATAIYCNRERTEEEVKVQDNLEKLLWQEGKELLYFRGKMLYYTADLPFPVTHTPDIFSQFRKEVERIIPVRDPFPAPVKQFQPISVPINAGDIPTMEKLGFIDVDNIDKSGFEGGETAALKRLHDYLWETEGILKYKETRNGMLGRNFSSRFSAWLAMGCLSPKIIYHEIRRFEKERMANESTYWLIFELLWRDFFRLMGKKYKSKIFQIGGTRDLETHSFKTNLESFQKWADGNTGVPFIDANMKELNSTGFMSNRGRQVVASFLAKDLKINWLLGAEYFESVLIDYDVCSNYGNWNYVAGVGSDPREDRSFNIQTQSSKYDQNGQFVKHWLPELKQIPADKLIAFNSLSANELSSFGVNLGGNYPFSMISFPKYSKRF
jgi:deoxyribodipyrimidine photo-lyase